MLKWFTPGASAKAIWAFLTALQPFLLTVSVQLPGFLNEAWLSAVLLGLAPVIVWMWPNKAAPK